MKISMEWLGEFLPQAPSPEACGDALTHGGLPVEVIERVGPDTVMDVEVTSNRGDCLSHLGVARELGALLKLAVREPEAAAIATAGAIDLPVKIEAPDLCPHYTARIIRGVKIGPSPAWMQRRLEAVGVRPINNVVDVTNYVLFELGQPLHAFDLANVQGRQIVVRRARLGETIVSLDGHERKLSPDMLVIADANRAVALAGVMGGKDSEVSQATVDVLLESARFDPLSVRKTARVLTMKSDSSYRFERGIDPTLPMRASLRAAQLILETAGGTLVGGVAEAGSENYSPKKLSLRAIKLSQVLGMEVDPAIAMDVLTRLRLSPQMVRDGGLRFDVTVPSDRLDLNVEIDLVEEVARVMGYGLIPTREEISIRVVPPEADRQTLELIRSTAIAAGYFEAITFSFVSDLLAKDFIPAEATGLPRAEAKGTADANLRPSLIPGLLESVRRNESVGNLDVKLFEIGSTFWLDKNGKVDERRRIGFVGSTDVRELRGVIEAIAEQLDAARPIKIAPANLNGFAPGAAATITWGDQTIGHFGLVSQAIADKLGLRSAPSAGELELPALLAGAQHVPQLKALPRFPAIRRDISLVMPESAAYATIDSLVASLNLANLETVEHVTTYRGKPLEKGNKSVTITLVFRAPEATLTSEAVEGQVQRVIEAAKSQLGATVRI